MAVEIKSAAPSKFSEMKWLRYVQEAKVPNDDSFNDYRLALRKESIYQSQIPGYSYLLAEGMKTAKQACEGSLSSLKPAFVASRESIVVEEQEFAFGSPKHISNSRYLLTYDIQTCVCIAAYNPRQTAGFIAHAFEPVNAFDAIEKAIGLLEAKTIVLLGGWKSSITSEDTIAIAEALIAKNDKSIKLVGRNTLTPPNTKSLGLDTMTGELFIPSNRPTYTGIDCYLLRTSKLMAACSTRHLIHNGKPGRSMSVADTINDNLRTVKNYDLLDSHVEARGGSRVLG